MKIICPFCNAPYTEEMNKDPIAVLTQRAEAIDLTPIYYIRLTKNLKAGTVLRFDSAESDIYKESPKHNA